jgi:hypothetical protein
LALRAEGHTTGGDFETKGGWCAEGVSRQERVANASALQWDFETAQGAFIKKEGGVRTEYRDCTEAFSKLMKVAASKGILRLQRADTREVSRPEGHVTEQSRKAST